MILTNKNQYLNSEDQVYFPDCSIGFSTSMNLYLVSEDVVTDLSVSFKLSESFSTYSIDTENVVKKDILTINDVVYSQAGGYHIYKINLLCHNETSGNYEDTLTIEYGTANGSYIYSITCNADIVGLQPETTVTLQNFKKFVTEEYMEAMYETESQASGTDFTIYNRKVREYLLNLATIETLVGSYKSLDSALSFFGYGELLDLKEYWFSKDTDSYKWSSIRKVIDNAIDKSLAGYKKSNQLALVYQINEAQGVDADGLPIYVNVLNETDEILFKLWTLERILERDFLFLNSHIVDIIGEFQSVIGMEFNVVLNDLNVSNINLSEEISTKLKFYPRSSNLDGSITDLEIRTDDNYLTDPYIESMAGDPAVNMNGTDNYFIPILRHSVILTDTFAFEPGAPNLLIKSGAVSGHLRKEFFDIETKVENDTDLSTQDNFLTKYYNGDFGLIDFQMSVDPSKYQAYNYVVINNDDALILFESKRKKILNPIEDILFGIRRTGKFTILVYLLDHFGGYSVTSINKTIEIGYENVDIKIGVYGAGQNPHDIKMWSSFDDTTGVSVVPIVNSISEDLSLARWTESDFDMQSTWTNLNQLNGIPLKAMKGLPLYIHGYLYNVFVYDIIGDGLAGDRSVSLSLFENKPKDVVTLNYDGVEAPIEYLQRLISLLNSQNSDGVFGKFTWDIHFYSNDPSAVITDARPMLRGKAKQAGFKSRNYFHNLSLDNAHTDFPEAFYQRDVRLFSKLDSVVSIPIIDPSATGDLIITYRDVENSYQSITINSVNDLFVTLQQFIEDYSLENIKVTALTDVVNLSAGGDISISHPSFGTQVDVQRGVFNDNILHIPLGHDIQLGEPVFAFIDEKYRINVADVNWILIDSLTNKTITEQHSWAFRWVMVQEGSYSLKLETTYHDGSVNTSIANGCYLVRGFIDSPEGINFWSIGNDFIIQ